MRKIVIIVGSKNDLPQCLDGLKLLSTDKACVNIYVRSVHRHLGKLLWLLQSLHTADDTDIIIAGAGKAAHLPGCIDAFLRNHFGDDRINVIGVAFEGATKEDNQSASLSITQVPGTQVRYAGLGKVGFKKACFMALNEPLSVIKRAEIPITWDLSLAQAIDMANGQQIQSLLRPASAEKPGEPDGQNN